MSNIWSNMAVDLKGKSLVIMGVSGAGKSTIGEMLAKRLKCTFLDADEFHSESNKDKMHQGIPLSEEDRIPWLKTLKDVLRKKQSEDKTVVLGCSALQKGYREILRSSNPNYQLGSYESSVIFIMLDVKAEVLQERLNRRVAEGKHFMSPKLLQSQLNLLQVDDSEGISIVDATMKPEVVVNTIITLLSK